MKRLVVAVFLLLSINFLSSQPLSFDYNEEWNDKTSVPDGEINITRLQWVPSSHNFWVDDKGSIYVYSADDLTTKKMVLSADQIKKAGLATRTESIVWNTSRDKVLSTRTLRGFGEAIQKEIIGILIWRMVRENKLARDCLLPL